MTIFSNLSRTLKSIFPKHIIHEQSRNSSVAMHVYRYLICSVTLLHTVFHLFYKNTVFFRTGEGYWMFSINNILCLFDVFIVPICHGNGVWRLFTRKIYIKEINRVRDYINKYHDDECIVKLKLKHIVSISIHMIVGLVAKHLYAFFSSIHIF